MRPPSLFRRLRVLLAALGTSLGAALAHDPGLSALAVALPGSEVKITATFSPDDVAGILAVAPSELDAARLRLLSPEVVLITAGDHPITPTAIDVQLDLANNDATFSFTYPAAAASSGPWKLRATLLARLPPGHRQYATASDASGRVVVEKLLHVGADSFEIAPPVAASSPPLSSALPPRAATPALGFVALGVEHILTGLDHLLFVLALVLIVRDRWMLVKTITAFTAAHSITLALATLGYARIPTAPLDAAIALSIFLLAPEILRAQRGGTSFMLRHPWIVAFAFGLLHGFGFAGGLLALGIPGSQVPAALLYFNLGVEIGQLGFVAFILAMQRAFVALEIRWARWALALPACSVGALGALWTLQRAWLLFTPAK